MADTEFGQTTGQNVDTNLEIHLALALYLSTYADGNMTTKKYLNALSPESQGIFFAFLTKVLDEDKSFDLDFKSQVDKHIDDYRFVMKRIVNGDTRLQVKMLGIRKFFSCPWLVCPDLLIRNLS